MCCEVLIYQQGPLWEGSGQTCALRRVAPWLKSSQPACSEREAVSCAWQFFLTWSVFWKGRKTWVKVLFYFAFLYSFLILVLVSWKECTHLQMCVFSFKFLYLSSSSDTPKNYIPENLYACLSLKLHADLPAVLLLQIKTVISKAGVLTDTIKPNFSMASRKLNLAEIQTVLSAVHWNIMQWLSLLCVYAPCDF